MNGQARRWLARLVATAAVTLAAPAFALAQCPMCKQALEGDMQMSGEGLARGFAASIYVMVALPYVLLGIVIFLVWRAYRRRPAARAEGGGAVPPAPP